MTSTSNQKQKIAILGGGVGGVMAAFALSDQPGWQERYDITVYQMGWRLGGKCASGRDADNGERILEHGLHIWLGFYQNAFRMIRKCYGELRRPADAPLATWQDAFKKHSLLTLMEQRNGQWVPWILDFPTNNEVPGDGGVLPKPWDYLRMLLQWLVEKHDETVHGPVSGRSGADGLASALWEFLIAILRGVCRTVAAGGRALFGHRGRFTHLHAAHRLAQSLPANPHQHEDQHHETLIELMSGFLRHFVETQKHNFEANDDLRRLWIWLRLGAAVIIGMIRDKVIWHGFDVIDQYDLVDWLERHGADKEVAWSAPIRGIYDLVLAYENGDTGRRNLSAGVGLRGTLRMLFAYKGAIFWKMQAGMGDTIFTPLYEVLTRRGVRFEFFHRVDNLALSPDSKAIDRIDVTVQATAKDGSYQPLRTVKGLPCWPSAPLYEQLVEGEELRRQEVDLESAWAEWPGVKKQLQRGRDFDLVILGIPVGALPYITRELMQANPNWHQMVTNIKTVQTLALQLWFNHDAPGLGWDADAPALVSSYVEPLNTWCDMSQLIDREAWPSGAEVRNISYLCGPLQDDIKIPAPFSNPNFPATQLQRVKQISLNFLQTSVRALWPDATSTNNPSGLNWEYLVDLRNRQGQARLDAQFFRANIDPSERYTLSVKGSTGFRLRSDNSGFTNLYLAGDWTDTCINAGCVEAATISGLQASREICDYPRKIIGESDEIDPKK
jgi:uncharacterized protein with NAD-binding domain and iron-sulfur cluster